MYTQEAQERRHIWFGRPCMHPKIEQEGDLGIATGRYVCVVCGSPFSKVSMWETVHTHLQQKSVQGETSSLLVADQ
ncbi:MAG: hypothetical protein NVSMB49_05240 [Ktedonobacteraceae bacterium]